MKILISAYACEPNRGSEPGVGWNWVLAYKDLAEVWVITRENNRPVIEAYEREHGPTGIHWYFHDCGSVLRWLKKRGLGVHAYYRFWQRGIVSLAKKLHAEVAFDAIHHVTFVSHRDPSHLHRVGPPFIFGPVAGSDHTPTAFLSGFPWRERFAEHMRHLVDTLQPWIGGCGPCLRRAAVVLAVTPANQQYLSRSYNRSVLLRPAMVTAFSAKIEEEKTTSRTLRLVYAGQLLPLKGCWLILPALQKYVQEKKFAPGEGVRFTMIGKGPDEFRLRKMAQKMRINPWIEWVPWLSQSDLFSRFAAADALVFPSLHDSGGMVVLEANAQGCPAIVLNLGGPAMAVQDGVNGFVLPATSISQVTQDLVTAFDRVRTLDPVVCQKAVQAFTRPAITAFLRQLHADLQQKVANHS